MTSNLSNFRWRAMKVAMLFVAALSRGSTTPVFSPPVAHADEREQAAEMPPMIVSTVQYLLRAKGFATRVDGKMGTQTRRQIQKFQRSRGLKVDDIVGEKTWDALIVRLKKGERGDAVRALQALLRADAMLPGNHGKPSHSRIVVDGHFGAQTEQALKNFQKSAGLTVDGIAGAETWGAFKGMFTMMWND